MSEWTDTIKEVFVRASTAAGLPRSFIDGIQVEVTDRDTFRIYNNWTGLDPIRNKPVPLAKFFILGTKDHDVWPVLKKWLHWKVGDKKFFYKHTHPSGIKSSNAWDVATEQVGEILGGRVKEDIRADIFKHRSGAV